MSKNEKKHSTIKEIRKVKLSELQFAQYNPRSIGEEAMAGLRASIRRFGIVDLIVMNDRTGNVVGGHQRIKAAIAEGITESDIVIVDLPETEEKVLNVTLNNPHIQGEFVGDMLEPILDEIREEIGDEVYEDLVLDELSMELLSPEQDEGGIEDFSGNMSRVTIIYEEAERELLENLLGIESIQGRITIKAKEILKNE